MELLDDTGEQWLHHLAVVAALRRREHPHLLLRHQQPRLNTISYCFHVACDILVVSLEEDIRSQMLHQQAVAALREPRKVLQIFCRFEITWDHGPIFVCMLPFLPEDEGETVVEVFDHLHFALAHLDPVRKLVEARFGLLHYQLVLPR
mmetsp:Transcript_10894/g.11027  ORF Transcript_10894/g.11027 Transcript_10894/m.11027 type:complete len:148 (-) Transcript_10894:1571-2014(-)